MVNYIFRPWLQKPTAFFNAHQNTLTIGTVIAVYQSNLIKAALITVTMDIFWDPRYNKF